MILLASSALVVGGQAFAADLPARMPVKAPPVVAAVPYTWTGCHVGGNVGAGWDRTNFSDPGTFATPFFGPPALQQNIAPLGSSIGVNGGAGVVGGVQAGCDYQFADHWVIGLGGDFALADIRGVGSDPFFSGKNNNPITLSTRTNTLASVTGRVGYAWDHFLLYGKGGAAWAHDRYGLQNLDTLNGNFCFNAGFVACNPNGSTTRAGWTAGAGLEWAFTSDWSALLEYDHYGFGGKNVLFNDPNGPPVPAVLNIKQDLDVVKVGINYRFWSPAPVGARY
ncbi:MAG: outer membrane protein [Xanthobacteraceae bacterium]